MSQSITRLQSSIDHLVLSAKVELGRADEPAGGLRAVVEAISDLSPEVARPGSATIPSAPPASPPTLKNSGTLETAQHIANHESPRTTKLYDRRQEFAIRSNASI